MLAGLISQIQDSSPVAVVIISIALMLTGGFLMSRFTSKLKLPNVTAYIITGIIMGPFFLKLIPDQVIRGSAFLPDIALAFIAFSTGEFFKIETLKKNGMRVVIITILESCMAAVFIFILTFVILKLSLPFSIVLAALATATAPASTIMTIRQTGAKGDFVDTLLQVVALDDVVGLVLYSIAIAVAVASLSGGAFSFSSIAFTIFKNILVMLLGCAFGLLLKLFNYTRQSTDNRLIIAIASLFGFCGICALIDLSPLLGCMLMGMVYINTTGDERLFHQLNYFSPPILLLFFVRSGLSFDIGSLFSHSENVGHVPLLLIGILYFFVRIIGKYVGAYVGCRLVKKDKKVTDFLGLALIPQAGVAIGLAALGARTLGGPSGNALETIILSSSVLYELIGPACGKLSLYLSGSYGKELEDIVSVPEKDAEGHQKSEVQLLIDRIAQIQKELPARQTDPDEAAFAEAAEEQRANLTMRLNHRYQQGRRFK